MNKLNINKKMDALNCDAILLNSLPSRTWFVNFPSTQGLILITKTKNYFFIDSRYIKGAIEKIKNCEVVEYKNIDSIKEIIIKNKINNLGISKESTTIENLEMYKELNVNFVYINTRKIREQKTDEEINYLIKSAEINSEVFNEIIKWIKHGVTEIEVSNQMHRLYIDKGCIQTSFRPIVAFGPNSAVPHHEPTNKTLEKGDMIKIDSGCVYKGYCSDMTRSFMIDEPTTKQKEVWENVKKAKELAIEKIKVGVLAKEIDETARKFIQSKGYGKNFVHGTGHGIGVEIHEEPMITINSTDKLKSNVAFSVEPGIYLENEFGVRIEDIIILKDNEIINLGKNTEIKLKIN